MMRNIKDRLNGTEAIYQPKHTENLVKNGGARLSVEKKQLARLTLELRELDKIKSKGKFLRTLPAH